VSDPAYRTKYGPWALVTGGAEGIGGAFADQLAERGLDLVLVDQNGDAAAARAEILSKTHGVDVRVSVVDLSEEGFYERIRPLTDDLEIGMLVCNAGVGTPGSFFHLPLEEHLRALDVNCRAGLVLTHELGSRMVERGRGGIILVGSDAAYQGTPYVASYAATKAFNLILGEGLWYEGREDGIDVLGFAPGPTNTEGQRRGNPRLREGATPKGFMLPEPTARAALAALGRVPSARPDWWNRLETFIAVRLLSRRRAVERIGRRTRTLRRAPRRPQDA
jgi:short-subunit dehydrogenase